MSEHSIKIFYSYSRKDLDMRNTLEDHLSALREAGRISTWHDLQLEAGEEWEPAILNKLDTADIILLLVSRNFIASKYCYGTELKRAIARHEDGTARVIPIILRHCDWNHPDVPFSKLNVLPTHAKTITQWKDRDAAFAIVAQKIRETVDQLNAQKQAKQQAEERKRQQLLSQRAAEQTVDRERLQREQQRQTNERFTLESMDDLFREAPTPTVPPPPQSHTNERFTLEGMDDLFGDVPTPTAPPPSQRDTNERFTLEGIDELFRDVPPPPQSHTNEPFTLKGMDDLFGDASLNPIQPVQPVKGDDLRLDLRLDFQEAVLGGEKEIRFRHLESCNSCAGKGEQGNLQEQIPCPSCDGGGRMQTTKKLRIHIPAGVDTGTRLRVSGEGDAGRYKGGAGDLYVYLSVNEDKQFKRDGINISSNIEIFSEQAASGCKLPINTIHGSYFILIPEGTKHRTVFRLSNLGVPKLGNSTQRGNHLVTVLIANQLEALRHRFTESQSASGTQRGEPTSEPLRSSHWDDPLVVIATGIGLLILSGISSWSVMRAILNNQHEPIPITAPTSTPSNRSK